MKTAPIEITHWPAMPTLPPPGRPVLVRVDTTSSRPVVRQELRMALRQILAAWRGSLPEDVPLRETSRGPVFAGQICGHALDISLSHADGSGWIGLLRAGRIGVDAVRIQPFAEMESVALHYLDETARQTIQKAADPAAAFAWAWTQLEARLKCLKRGLSEWPETQLPGVADFDIQTMFLSDSLVVTVATISESQATALAVPQKRFHENLAASLFLRCGRC